MSTHVEQGQALPVALLAIAQHSFYPMGTLEESLAGREEEGKQKQSGKTMME